MSWIEMVGIVGVAVATMGCFAVAYIAVRWTVLFPLRYHRSGVEILGAVIRDSQILADQIKRLPLSVNRHGDMQVCLSASLRLVENFKTLIEQEQSQ
jgi:hypothetical protein